MRIPADEVNSTIQNAQRKHTYTVWGIPPDHIVQRIKKIMEPLRAEFGGPEIEPHITAVGSVLLTHDYAVKQFINGCENIEPYTCEVDQVVTRKFYYQPVSLLFHPCPWQVGHFGGYLHRCNSHMPHLSLLYGNLTEEERKRALEKVTELDDSIASLKFTISHLVLYKTHNEARDQHSWEKVMEYNLRQRN
ncbi:cyclic phosphodiesterase-like isoform X1 [Rosa rugosa]|uniref:cyclic phosphodiesterase-like isoform X1 n=1 Tax=Rosa rugosa TaxID=74645 RepID=UPI002B40099C|nr:cyclic phosphodiesterase-like isoform X1 [Rosa rugosa]